MWLGTGSYHITRVRTSSSMHCTCWGKFFSSWCSPLPLGINYLYLVKGEVQRASRIVLYKVIKPGVNYSTAVPQRQLICFSCAVLCERIQMKKGKKNERLDGSVLALATNFLVGSGAKEAGEERGCCTLLKVDCFRCWGILFWQGCICNNLIKMPIHLESMGYVLYSTQGRVPTIWVHVTKDLTI